jgi:hypothetical protein
MRSDMHDRGTWKNSSNQISSVGLKKSSLAERFRSYASYAVDMLTKVCRLALSSIQDRNRCTKNPPVCCCIDNTVPSTTEVEEVAVPTSI